MRILTTAAAMLLCACAMAFPSVVPEASSEYVPTGEVNLMARNASFDHYRVRSVKMNLAKRTDGSWAGTFDNRPIDVSVDENTVRGVEIIISRSDSTPGHQVFTGQFQGRIFRFELDGNKAMIRTPSFSNNLEGREVRGSDVWYGGQFSLKGEAGAEPMQWPQLGFALVAAFI